MILKMSLELKFILYFAQKTGFSHTIRVKGTCRNNLQKQPLKGFLKKKMFCKYQETVANNLESR